MAGEPPAQDPGQDPVAGPADDAGDREPEAGPAQRVCGNGHVVTEDYLHVCPRCGLTLERVPRAGRAPSLAPRSAPAVSAPVPKTLPFLFGAVVLGLFALLLIKGAEHGPAEDFAWVLLVAAVLVGAAGVLDGLRHRRT